jgi:hypothetical protein
MEFQTKTKQVVLITQREFDVDGQNSETITAKTIVDCTNGKVQVRINTPPTAEAVVGSRRERLNKLRSEMGNHATDEGYKIAANYGFEREVEQPGLFDDTEDDE